ncbi:MAG: class I SAM-dependent DNA methyltransferase [Gemmatimonadaceae bacterium]
MPLSWNEIRHRAITFSNEWSGESREAAERQTYWNEFFNVFGIRRRTVAAFEEPVKKLSGSWGAIDLFWPGKLLVEHKSAGQDLGKAHSQAMAYVRGLQDSGRDKELPRWVIVSDFARIALHDLEPEDRGEHPRSVRASIEFALADLHKHIRHFAFIAGYTAHRLDPEDPANLEATQLMCNLHDALEAGGYAGHELKRFLVRILFCLFADDTGIFPPKAFELFILDRTKEDGSDLGVRLEQLFRVLNTDVPNRQTHLDEDLREFPYVNGELFAERLDFADFDATMRDQLIACCRFRWETISPAVFGSLFQSVMVKKERRQIGAHYTAETNILKLIRSLFLDELRAEFQRLTALKIGKAQRLAEFQGKLAKLRFLDPACGCGNFLVLTYRELRKLELDVLVSLHGEQREMSLEDANRLSLLNVHQFHGIEIEEFPARIAEVALWLTDHQANIALSEAFSQLVIRLPLRTSPHIVVANALQVDWNTVIPAGQCSYVLGNPPFVGKQFMSAEQKADMQAVCANVKGSGVLDYVTGWYFRSAEYARGGNTRCAFVSTNSISQGEQPGILWAELYGRHRMQVQFAHRTFVWQSEGRGKAQVHVVIVGFGSRDIQPKVIWDYDVDEAHPTRNEVASINPYLVEGSGVVLAKRSTPLAQVPEISFGSMPNDGGFLLLSREERDTLLRDEPAVDKFVRRYFGPEEFINGTARYCLWLVDAAPNDLRSMRSVMARIEAVRDVRSRSRRAATHALARTPALFGEIRQPSAGYLAIPKTSSEARAYIPIAFLEASDIAGSDIFTVAGATLWHFGVLTSQMHMAWVRYVCGRLKSDYRYSAGIAYNNFPWPTTTAGQRQAVEKAAQLVLDARAGYPGATLADLYDPTTMPRNLAEAHWSLDRAVDRSYRGDGFGNERARVEFLFRLYEQVSAPLLPSPTRRVKNKRR